MPSLTRFALDLEPLRVHRDFRLILSGQVINNLGSQMTQVALPYQLYVLTGSALALGAMAACQLAAVLIFSPLAGAITDAVDRRRLLIVTQAALASVSLILALLALTGRTAPWHLFVLAFVQGIFNSVDRPARQSVIPRLVSRERITAAIAINQVANKASSVVGPGIGGLLIAGFGVGAAFGVDAVSFGAGLIALGMIAALPPVGLVAKPGWAAIMEGVRFVRTVPTVLAAFAIDLNAMIFGMPVALFPVLALDFFHAGPTGLGLLVAAPSAGGVLGALCSGWVTRVRFPGRIVIGAVIVWGVTITLFGLMPSLPLALIFLTVAGGADATSGVVRWSIIQLSAPDNLRGRVTSLNSMVVNAGPRLGDMEAAAVATLTSAQISVVSGGLLSLIGLAFVVKNFPQLATYERPTEAPVFESARDASVVLPAGVVAAAQQA